MNSKSYKIRLQVKNKFLEQLEVSPVESFTRSRGRTIARERIKTLIKVIMEEDDLESLFRIQLIEPQDKKGKVRVPRMNEWYLRD